MAFSNVFARILPLSIGSSTLAAVQSIVALSFRNRQTALMKPCILTICLLLCQSSVRAEPFAGTQALTWDGDIASRLVDAADAFLLAKLQASINQRPDHWQRDSSSVEAYAASLEPNRKRLAHIAGVRDARVTFEDFEYTYLGATARYTIYAVRWPVLGDVHGEGILLDPKGDVTGNVVVIPDANQHPEQLAGMQTGLDASDETARLLAESGCRVVVPVVINREVTHRKLSNREFIYRSAFILGRHVIGYEVQKVLAVVDWFERREQDRQAFIGVMGWGEGGLLAFYAAALDIRIDRTLVSGYFGSRQSVWDEPAYRNVFGLLEQFGDAEIASMIAPRQLIVDSLPGPEEVVPAGTGGKPGQLRSATVTEIDTELKRAHALTKLPGAEAMLSRGGLSQFCPAPKTVSTKARPVVILPDQAKRHARQLHEMDRHNQLLLRESSYVRKEFMDKLKTDSLEAYEQSLEHYRAIFGEDVIGQFDDLLTAPNPRTRLLSQTDKVTSYEVVLDVFPGLFAYGILSVPCDAKAQSPRPVVVCQHGLEGRPQDTIGEPGYHYYKAFSTKLAERGFITFAPQNLYIFEDRFRTLQFKANALKKTLFSLMVPQHQQIVDWLGGLNIVDAERIGFYGLSYGGKSAMRIPALVPEYCLSICSADFNEWVWKNASTRSRYSYVWTGEYEIFEFDLGSTFNYAEMAALIAPRPFMVERGHFDGVAPDETVGFEYAKVRHLYSGKLKIPERTEIEWFDGPHTINGKATYAFLHKHLNWPAPSN